MPPVFLAALVIGGILILSRTQVAKMVAPKAAPALARTLATKWGGIWGVPAGIALTIMKIESSFRPGLSNTNERAMKLGGAWGLMAMTLTTAKGLAPQIQAAAGATTNPASRAHILAAVGRFNGTGVSLLDADTNACFGCFFLAKLYREFKTLDLVAAAYHQGAGKVREMQKAKRAIPEQLPPFGKEYVARARAAAKTLGVA
jgi:soluble lytic murein transglycosylase-like protein